ncbi:MAG: pentapeptide repeat-containing protein, partial [Cyanobacteria bacterium P01_D01_bin.115]
MDVKIFLRAYSQGDRNFQAAILHGVDLSNCNLSGIDLSRADLSGANLS